jgi:LysR family glycine cleavage system transcriptional activator
VPALLSFWIIPRLNRFTEQYPGIRLSLVASNDPAQVFSRDVDVAILYGDGNWPDCWTRLWSHLRLFPVASPTLLNSRPLRSVRDLADHTLLHGDRDGREWNTWFAAADAIDLPRGPQLFTSDARLSTEAAVHGQGIALGDTITAAKLIARGELVVPFDLTVPANDAFYVACRQEVRAAPIARVFIDWLFASLEEDSLPEPQTSARMLLRGRNARAADDVQPVSAPSGKGTATTQKRKARG